MAGKFKKVPIGNKYNRWTVVGGIKRTPNNTLYLCECDCGTLRYVERAGLISGRSKSCGCWKREVDIARHYVHGQSYNRIYSVWKNMLKRCNDPNHKKYKYYGGKGISVCKEWKVFKTFYKWATENGYSDKLFIDRIDNSKNYEPSNCRFVKWEIQAKNKSPWGSYNKRIK